MLSKSLLALFLSLSISSSFALDAQQTFTLRHVHATHAESGRIRWGDVPEDVITASLLSEETIDGSSTHIHSLETRRTTVHRPLSQVAFHAARTQSRKSRKQQTVLSRIAASQEWGQSLGWDEDDVEGPATNKRETVLALAKMTNNAYLSPGETGWYDLGGNWTAVSDSS